MAGHTLSAHIVRIMKQTVPDAVETLGTREHGYSQRACSVAYRPRGQLFAKKRAAQLCADAGGQQQCGCTSGMGNIASST